MNMFINSKSNFYFHDDRVVDLKKVVKGELGQLEWESV